MNDDAKVIVFYQDAASQTDRLYQRIDALHEQINALHRERLQLIYKLQQVAPGLIRQIFD